MKFYSDFNAMFEAQSVVKKDMGVFNRVYKDFDGGDGVLGWNVRTTAPLYGEQNVGEDGLGDSVYYIMYMPEKGLSVFNDIKRYWGGEDNFGADLGYIHPLRKLSNIAFGFVRDFCSSHPLKPKISVYGTDADQIDLKFVGGSEAEVVDFGRELAEYLDKNAIPKIAAECGLYQSDIHVPEDNESVSFGGDRYSFV